MIKITKTEMQHLTSHGVNMGNDGISHTTARHRRTYYLTESSRNMRKLEKYRKNRVVTEKVAVE